MWYYFTLFQTTFSKQNNPRLLPTKPLFSQERVASLLLSRLSLWEISTLLACLLTYYAGPKYFCPKQHWFCCASVLARKNVINSPTELGSHVCWPLMGATLPDGSQQFSKGDTNTPDSLWREGSWKYSRELHTSPETLVLMKVSQWNGLHIW